MAKSADSGNVDALVARQPIFNRERKLYGYELLFRSDGTSNAFDGTEAGVATTRVISNMLLSIGTEQLLDGKKAFINFDHRLLLEDMHLTLPTGSVIEILETVVPTQDLVALCRGIRQKGYSVALDDFTDEPEWEPLASVANLIKVDMRVSSRQQQERMLRTYKPRGVQMLAEKVENYSEFKWAWDAGYDLFQGYFFARPAVVRGQQISSVRSTCLQLLREVHQADLDYKRLERLIGADVSLTHKLLRYTNSALFQRGAEVQSIHRALVTVGTDNIRRWAALATLPMLATNKPPELVKLSLVRAQFCERLAPLGHIVNSNEAFLMGMFSLLDALIDQPLEEGLRSIGLGKEVTETLVGIAPGDSLLACLYQLIRCYEQGNWDEVERLSHTCGIPLAVIGEAYFDSTVWAENIVHALDN